MSSSRGDTIDAILDWTNKAATLGQNVSSVVPVPAFGPIFATFSTLVKQIQKTRKNKKAVKDVLADIHNLAHIIGVSMDQFDRGIKSLSELEWTEGQAIHTEFQNNAPFQDSFNTFLRDLERLVVRSQDLKQKGKLLRFLFSSQDAAIIKDIKEGVLKASTFFQTQCQVETGRVMQAIDDRLQAQADRNILDSLFHVNAGYRASINKEKGDFLDGTQSELLAELERWIKGGLSSMPVCVLSRAAGTGKSTVASELAKQLDGEGKLGASFFFNRGITDLDSPRLFFSTLAYQLANWKDGTLRKLIVEATRKHMDRNSMSQAMKYQASELLYAPLKQADKDTPIYVVVDALDECTQDAAKLVPEMLDLLLAATEHGPLRIFLTSRPDPHIEYKLNNSQWSSIIHTISTSDYRATRDVERLVQVRLREIAYGPELLERRPEVAVNLARRAQGLFIYARTAVNFLKTYPGTLDEGVDRLLLGESKGFGLGALDQLYLTVLTHAFPPDTFQKDPLIRERMQFLLACIALQKETYTRTPQFVELLTSRTDAPITCQDSDSVLNHLRAVIIFERDKPKEEFRSIHATFPQFLVDKTRCTNELYLVDSQKYHVRMAEACLRTMLAIDENIYRLEHLEQLGPLEPLERMEQLERLEQMKWLEQLEPLQQEQQLQWLQRLQRQGPLERLERLERIAGERLKHMWLALQTRFLDPSSPSADKSSILEKGGLYSIILHYKLVGILLPELLQDHVQYACKHWVAHLSQACGPNEHEDKACSCRNLIETLQHFFRDWDNFRRVEIINLMASYQTLEVDRLYVVNWHPSDIQDDVLRSQLRDALFSVLPVSKDSV